MFKRLISLVALLRRLEGTDLSLQTSRLQKPLSFYPALYMKSVRTVRLVREPEICVIDPENPNGFRLVSLVLYSDLKMSQIQLPNESCQPDQLFL